jgi:Cu-Zn family superoxide dismutase
MRGIIIAALLVVGGSVAAAEKVATFEAPILGAKGEPIGQVAIRSGENAIVVRIMIAPGGLTPGWHGVHFHAVGDCSDVGAFERAKDVIRQESNRHGFLNPDGPLEGDLANVFAAADGSVNAELTSESITLIGPQGLRDADGSALVIYAGEDDHTSQPAGNAGARVACAIIK